MLYRLFICRHAQAQAPIFTRPDFDRKLTEAGEQEAREAGQWVQQFGYKPDLILCSSANRTLSTARIIAAEVAYNHNNILYREELYDASFLYLISTISLLDKNYKNVLLVGHNPGISQMVTALSGSDKGRVPTGSVHCIWFEMEDWSEINYTVGLGYETNKK